MRDKIVPGTQDTKNEMKEPADRPKFLRGRTKIFYLPIVIVIFLGIIFVFRSFSGKSQTTKINTTGQNNSVEILSVPDKSDIMNWKSYFFEPLGLSLMVPSELIVHTEKQNPGDFTAFIQNFSFNAPYPKDNVYQLYIIWSKNYTLTQDEFNQFNNNLIATSIEDTIIAGYPAIKGQILGERSRFVTYIYKDKTQISLYTADTTESNKNLTDKILSTFTFQP